MNLEIKDRIRVTKNSILIDSAISNVCYILTVVSLLPLWFSEPNIIIDSILITISLLFLVAAHIKESNVDTLKKRMILLKHVVKNKQ